MFLLLGAAMFAFSAGVHFFWYGRGLAGAMEAHDAPERVRAARTVYVYDGVITVERDRVIFRRSLWAPSRPALLAALTAAAVTFAVRQRRKARYWMLAAAIVAFAITFTVSRSRHPVVTVPRGTQGKVEVQRYGVTQVGSSRTRFTAEDESGYDIVLVEGGRTTRLVRLPWNVEYDANLWRGLIEEKLRP